MKAVVMVALTVGEKVYPRDALKVVQKAGNMAVQKAGLQVELMVGPWDVSSVVRLVAMKAVRRVGQMVAEMVELTAFLSAVD